VIRRTLAVALLALTLAGCGTAATHDTVSTSATSTPAYITAPFNQEQKLVVKGAGLIVSDGCAACHLNAHASGLGPNFNSFAGHQVRLRDGRQVRVDEHFVREGLRHPAANELDGYDAKPMLMALARVHLRPAQVQALAAFIEQVGPETE
jgi:CxxC motif-containing protein (DUF1111 family)